MKDAFDNLAKALASGMSRRDALRRFGIATAGTLFAFGPAKAALAGGGGGGSTLADCETFCGFLYKRGSGAYRQCIQDAKHETGVCFDQGPASKVCRDSHCPKHTICMSNNVNFNHSLTTGGYVCMPIDF